MGQDLDPLWAGYPSSVPGGEGGREGGNPQNSSCPEIKLLRTSSRG